jgi:hypothetical protein
MHSGKSGSNHTEGRYYGNGPFFFALAFDFRGAPALPFPTAAFQPRKNLIGTLVPQAFCEIFNKC